MGFRKGNYEQRSRVELWFADEDKLSRCGILQETTGGGDGGVGGGMGYLYVHIHVAHDFRC